MPGLPCDDAQAPLFSVGQVADMLGVQQAFLRRLDSHDVVSPARSEGQQRRYSRLDVGQVQQALGLIDEGLTIYEEDTAYGSLTGTLITSHQPLLFGDFYVGTTQRCRTHGARRRELLKYRSDVMGQV